MSAANILTMLAMTLVTYATRMAGMLVGRRLPTTGRMKQALDALPAAVLTALIAPAVMTGPAAMTAAVATVVAATRLPLIAAMAVGMATAAITRLVV